MNCRRVSDWIGDTNSSEELGVEEVQCLRKGAPQQNMSNSFFNGYDIGMRYTESSKSGEAQRENEDTLVILLRSFMRLNMRVKQSGEHTGGTVASLNEYSGDRFRRGGKVRSRDSVHCGKKGKEKVE